jgi:5'-3' exonuclease
MIILDFQNIMLANLHAQVGMQNADDIEPNLLRHMILNSIRTIRSRYKNDYGEIVIACEERSWRRDIFPEYKASRAKKKDDGLDWDKIFTTMRDIRTELKENFPYRVIEAMGAEADDIIGVLCQDYGSEGLSFGEQIIIMSGDKDYAQLHKYANVSQYDWVRKKKIVPLNKAEKNCSAQEFLLEQIIRGDVADGVPNILSDNDTFVDPNKRQGTMTAKRLEEFKGQIVPVDADNILIKAEVDEKIKKNIERNWNLIDLQRTPNEIRDRIRSEYNAQAGKDRSKLFNYFMTKGLRNLMADISDF